MRVCGVGVWVCGCVWRRYRVVRTRSKKFYHILPLFIFILSHALSYSLVEASLSRVLWCVREGWQTRIRFEVFLCQWTSSHTCMLRYISVFPPPGNSGKSSGLRTLLSASCICDDENANPVMMMRRRLMIYIEREYIDFERASYRYLVDIVACKPVRLIACAKKKSVLLLLL